jgi:hypothetical protein
MEDELHFTLECPLYQKQRKTILDNLYIKFPNLYNLDHPNLFIWMMSNDDPVFLQNVTIFNNQIIFKVKRCFIFKIGV